jgi:hypothetical protein
MKLLLQKLGRGLDLLDFADEVMPMTPVNMRERQAISMRARL